MSYWRGHESKGLAQDFAFNPAERLCIHCHEYRLTVDDDGWCDSCAGRKPDAAESVRKTAAATLANARQILERKLLRSDPEAEVRWWRERVAALERELGLEPGAAA